MNSNHPFNSFSNGNNRGGNSNFDPFNDPFFSMHSSMFRSPMFLSGGAGGSMRGFDAMINEFFNNRNAFGMQPSSFSPLEQPQRRNTRTQVPRRRIHEPIISEIADDDKETILIGDDENDNDNNYRDNTFDDTQSTVRYYENDSSNNFSNFNEFGNNNMDTENDQVEEAIRRSLADEERRKREEERAEMEEEYLLSLEADREKQREKDQQEEERLQQERLAADQARLEADQAQKELQKREQLADKLFTLPAEPEASNAQATELVIRLPSGTRLSRRFLRSESLNIVKDFVDSQLALDPDTKLFEYEFMQDFPRQTYDNLSTTLEDAKLYPRALLNVRQILN